MCVFLWNQLIPHPSNGICTIMLAHYRCIESGGKCNYRTPGTGSRERSLSYFVPHIPSPPQPLPHQFQLAKRRYRTVAQVVAHLCDDRVEPR